jgi:hypothetical protein
MELAAPTPCGPAPPAAVYTQLSTAIAAIQAHTREHGMLCSSRTPNPPAHILLKPGVDE